MPEHGIVRRTAAQTLGIQAAYMSEKLGVIKAALENFNADNSVFYEDEVDIYLSPKTGASWGIRVVNGYCNTCPERII